MSFKPMILLQSTKLEKSPTSQNQDIKNFHSIYHSQITSQTLTEQKHHKKKFENRATKTEEPKITKKKKKKRSKYLKNHTNPFSVTLNYTEKHKTQMLNLTPKWNGLAD